MKFDISLSYSMAKKSRRHHQYLVNKQRGGAVNQKGNQYENFFALFKIIHYANTFPNHLEKIRLSAQSKSFVDDLLINNKRTREYYQLKTSKRLAWGIGKKKGTLNFDFSNQRNIEKKRKARFVLNLVVQDLILRNKLLQKRPKHLKTCTNLVHFPYFDSILKQIANDSNFRTQLELLSAINTPPKDKLEALANCILGYWVSSMAKGVVLAEIISKVQNIGASFIKPKIVKKMSKKVFSILSLIPNFTFVQTYGYVSWEYRNTDSGVIPYVIGSKEFNKIEKQIELAKPNNFSTLETLIS